MRHGLSVMNQQGVFSSTTDTPLAPEGIEQCRAAGRALQGAGIDCIVASPLKRAQHSAQLVAGELDLDPADILINETFTERQFGPLEGTTYQPNVGMDEIEGVEHSDELIARVSKGLEDIRALPADTVLIVSHGAVGRALYHLLHPEVPYMQTPKFHNATVEKLL